MRRQKGKKPTKKQAMFLTEHNLNHEIWLIYKDTPTEMLVVHRNTGEERTIIK